MVLRAQAGGESDAAQTARQTNRTSTGPQGETGPQGSPGEVTAGQLDAAIGGTARNPSGSVAPPILTISDPPTQGEVRAILDAHDALLFALQR